MSEHRTYHFLLQCSLKLLFVRRERAQNASDFLHHTALPLLPSRVQHLCQKSLVGDLVVEVLVVQELLHANTDDADLGQAHEDLAKLVLEVGVEAEAVLQQRGVHLLLALLHVLPVLQRRRVCNQTGTVMIIIIYYITPS